MYIRIWCMSQALLLCYPLTTLTVSLGEMNTRCEITFQPERLKFCNSHYGQIQIYYRNAHACKAGRHFCFWLSFPFNSIITNHKLSLMEDLKAILTVGAIFIVPFIAAPKVMFAIVLYIIVYMAFRWRNF